MKGLFVYRLLSFIVNLFCMFMAILLLFSVFMALANPAFAFGAFIMLGVVLYAWYANKFFNRVIVMKDVFTRRQKDWLQVNSIVAIVFAIMSIRSSAEILMHPHIVDEIAKQLPVAASPGKLSINTSKLMINLSTILLFFCVLLVIHICWTFILLRKHKDHIVD